MLKNVALVVALIVVLFIAWQFVMFARTTSKLKATVVENVDLQDVNDGTYEGSFDAYLVNARAKVQVEECRIVSIGLLEHEHGPKHSGEPMVQRILDAQSLDVDALTGATGSGIAVRKAVELALRQGQGRKAQIDAQQDAEKGSDESSADSTAL